MDLLEIIMLVIGAAIAIVGGLLLKSPQANSEADPYESGFFKQYGESLSSLSEEIINKTEDYLSKLSNEKIMAVSEYSDQILEKINRNHEEVVFLYNMLTGKEKELKETLKELNDVKRNAREVLLSNNEVINPENEQKEINHQKNTESFDKDSIDSQPASINNEEILNLHSQGMSILEISKKLGIGQGEVKLIIDLFSKGQ
ncbi:hypothetical protein DFR55_101299 [Herbinix hemicellulosilytica]|uniref:Uncharacterized protein n=1 Tax=Herbinix hemicellulosilytica TaxID=1564487 RepID=A0A0H5SW39_HERHM|nr:DUF6115 domain-containing protein [Herbinix hemicellulosilytica]RBP60838.1 hypothetical protein DFR55_101299 [Herbinix hemicellulosilytica]CRZ34533.1 hypothetical protein HHT355_1332 [Herbinix hemicellulosilytica]